ncbi:histone-fold-containing protein [Rostrohypoxylon terebratum]|nr:histone-fold-containing protein [Rostrohypoxylon terebratum]
MPPRKADSTRTSNVSMAQFVYDGSDADISSNALRPAAATTSVPSRAKPTPSIEMDSQKPTEPAPAGEKEKEKEKEKKDAKDGGRDAVTIEDLNLPKSIITRLAKGVLPPNTQIQANAVLAMCKSATVFINHLANAANEKAQGSNKKTIMPADVFEALNDIEFEFMRERLEAEFKKFNEVQTTKRSTYRRKVAAAKRAEKAAATDPNASIVSNASTAAGADSGAPRASKKQKPNAPDDSAMEIDGDMTAETQEQSDAETEPEAEQEEDEEEENDAEEEEEEEEEEEDGEDDPDRLEEREPKEDRDDALDDGDSD